MSTQLSVVEIDCRSVLRELVNYSEGDLPPEVAARIKEHLETCAHCKAVYDGARNVVSLLADSTVFDLPKGFSERLRACIGSSAVNR